jgi:Family of unknown function (DUF6504)
VNHRYRAERADVVAEGDEEPVAFRWRGRRYDVRGVVTHWVEAVPWWVEWTDQGCGQRHVWRVEATTRTGIAGVYDLYRITSDREERWGLERVID